MRASVRVASVIAGILFALLCTAADDAVAQKRVALLVGVDRYSKLEPRFQLQKAVNDAQATAAVLRKLGFSTQVLANPDLSQMIETIEALAQTVGPGDTVFLFFSGHGLSPEGSNLLLPSDFPDIGRGGPGMREIARRGAIAEAAVVGQFRERLTDKNTGQFNGLVIAVIDACRNNPFARTNADFRRAIGVAPTFRHQPSVGVFSIYSAGADQLALDRLSDSDASPTSVFTRVFLPELARPGVALSEAVVSARVQVVKLAATYTDPETGRPHFQTPAFYDQTQGGPIYLAGTPAGTAPVAQRP
ncbi:MAG: caspase domain-containing protein, partial [Pseudorhodoplanes sp.]